MIYYKSKALEMRDCELGRGIFTTENIDEYELIEQCHYILTHKDEQGDLLHDYTYNPEIFNHNKTGKIRRGKYSVNIKELKGQSIVMFGFGSIYNHSDEPNVYYYYNYKDKVFEFYTNRKISKDEQLFIFYGPKYFSSRKYKMEKL